MSWFTPDEYLTSVLAVDLDELQRSGVTTVLLDLDNTILSRERAELTPEYAAWCKSLVDHGFKVCILSNNHTKAVSARAQTVGFRFVCNAVKPVPIGYIRALKMMGSKRKETVMIGDQLFTDILGANVLGMRSIMVLPLAKKDLAHTLMLRKVEKLFMKDRKPER